MIYLFDTNAIIKIMNGDAGIIARAAARQPEDFGLSSLVLYELYFGAFKGRHSSRTIALIERLSFQIVDFQVEDARVAGEIRASLAAAGTPIGPYDTLIAGQALARDLTLITHNIREFTRVPGLKVEDWEV